MVNEIVVLLLLAVSSVSLAWLLGIRDVWLLFPTGLLGIVSIRSVTFIAVNLLSERNLANPVFYSTLFVICLVAAWLGSKTMYRAVFIAGAVAFTSVLATRVFNLTTMPEPDSLWVLSATRLFDQGQSLLNLGSNTSLHRGFAYPVMLALGEPGEFLSGFTPLVFGALLCATVWSIRTLAERSAARLYLSIILGLAVLTSAMVLRTIFYVSSHNLIALALLVAVVGVAKSRADNFMSRELFVTLCLAVCSASFTALEAPLLLTLVLFALFANSLVSTRKLMLLSFFTVAPFTAWFASYPTWLFAKPSYMSWVFALAITAVSISSVALASQLSVRKRTVFKWLAPAVLLATITLFQLSFNRLMNQGWSALFENLFLGVGQWGALSYLVLVGFILIFIARDQWKNDRAARQLLWFIVTFGLASVVLKTFATTSTGAISIRHYLWSDSLNRLWFELLFIVIVSFVVIFGRFRTSDFNSQT